MVLFIFKVTAQSGERVLFLLHQMKRKWALLESNPSGIHLMVDKNVNAMGYHHDDPLIFLETVMPSKTHL